MPALPTSIRGAVSDEMYSRVLYDALENVPELQPGYGAILEYARMAKDPTLAAILSSYTLQIRRASWAVDGTGCRPEVAQQVADDLGLPVLGKDAPGAARVRGVSWGEHLRAALLSLTYGHYGFELQAEMVDGRARLVGLWDRAPWTVNTIHVDPKTGAFKGITQDGLGILPTDRPQIPADRLAWYTHDRVGANHHGNSLLRPGYGVHMMKREILRLTAVAHRRFSMGVPVVEWAQGMSTLTPGQIAAAQQVASAARAGETAGASLPPGAMLKLVGLSGGVPDNLAFLRWLDTQLSRFALMPHIELGQNSAGGSRALGESFIDSWTLALGSIGGEIADTATRQIAARIVEWNWGLNEPVPTIRVRGIGEQRELTAEALQLLLTAGALDADPELKAWVRREYRLPEADPNYRPATPSTPARSDAPGPGGQADTTQVAAASRPRSPRSRKRSQPSLFGDDDDAAHRVQQQWDKAKARLLRRWPKLAAPMVAELADQARAAVEVGDVALLGDLRVSAGVVAALAVPIRKAGTDLAVEAAAGVVEEAAAQNTLIDAPDDPAADRVRQHADAVARIIAAGYASGAARTGLQLAGASPQQVRAEVERHLTELGESVNGLVGDNIGSLLSAAQFAGRLAVIEQHPADSYIAVEVNDRNRCQPCSDIAGRTFDSLRAALAEYPGGGAMRRCEGRGRCRGFISPRWV
jgi:hypothetical protein